jgi:putative thiamine transport system permease protein
MALNARGSVAAVLLTAALFTVAVLAIGLLQITKHLLRSVMISGPSPISIGGAKWQPYAGLMLFLAFGVAYAMVVAILIVMSCAGPWPFPNLLPDTAQTKAWAQLASASDPAVTSFLFSLMASTTAVAMAILWLETMPARFDHLLTVAAIVALAFPTLLLASGQYGLFLRLGLTGNILGLFLAHLMQVFAYVFIVLQGPYRAFDPRYKSVSLGLNPSNWRFWLAIKAPLLKPVLAAALAVGFAVGIAQYVPVQLVASGRFSTLTMEAVTLSSGGSRPLMAVYALALTFPVAWGFLLAAWIGWRKWRLAWG